MKIIVVAFFILFMIIAIVLIVLKSKSNNRYVDVNNLIKGKNKDKKMIVENMNDLNIKVETLPTATMMDEKKLVKITDNNVLTHINNLIPNLIQTGNAVNNALSAAQSGNEVLYRAVIPAGEELVKSKVMKGAVRGFYRDTDGVKGHANFVAVKAKKGSVAANSGTAAMGLASMIVGQYYMTQINNELDGINNKIEQISNFQDNEYRSKVFSLASHVKEIANFQAEILENDELRLSKVAQLDNLEEKCTQLLGQANLTLANFAKNDNLDYDQYEKQLEKAQSWYTYQNNLLEVLYKISELRYTLHLGTVSREQCGALLSVYTHQVEETQEKLIRWHQSTTKKLKIDIDEVRRKRGGFDEVTHFLPGLIKDDWRFKTIPKRTVSMIREQTLRQKKTLCQDTTNLYAKDVELISKNGKLYYVPADKNEA